MKNPKLALITITLIAGFLRFYNLTWGDGSFFHPDERNMASAVSQLCFQLPDTRHQTPDTCSMNPHFFAYGSLPLYLAYFSHQIMSFLKDVFEFRISNFEFPAVPFGTAVFWLRFWSALSSTLTIPLIFLISKRLLTFNFALLTAALAAFTPGLIQAAHFGTTESLLTFFFMLTLYLSLKLKVESKVKSFKNNNLGLLTRLWTLDFGLWTFLGIALGLALATKLTAVYFLLPVVLAIFLRKIPNNLTVDRQSFKQVFLFLLILSITFFLTSPYNFLDFREFLRTSTYEAKVAAGQIQTFYTRQFINTPPLLFQITHIFPYALGWPIFILGSAGVLHVLTKISKDLISWLNGSMAQWLKIKNHRTIEPSNHSPWILILTFLAYFIPNAFLSAKWTRFMTPIFPFFAIFAAYFFHLLFTKYQVSSTNHQLSHQKTPQSEVSGDSEMIQSGEDSQPMNFITQIKEFVKSKVERTGIEPVESRLRILTLNHSRPTITIVTILLLFVSILPGLSFFQIYTKPDVRLQASDWIYKNILDSSYILSETGNVIDIPLTVDDRKWKVDFEDRSLKLDKKNPASTFQPQDPSSTLYHLTSKSFTTISFDFYHLEENPALLEELVEHLERADYILVPSRRIFANHLRLPETYPITSRYYQALFDGSLGFKLVWVQTSSGGATAAGGKLLPTSRQFIESNPEEKKGDHHQGNRNNDIGIKIPEIEFSHNSSIFFSKFTVKSKNTIPQKISLVKSKNESPPVIGQKLGATITKPKKPEARLINKAERALSQGLDNFLTIFTLAESSSDIKMIEDEAAEETWSVFDHPVIRIFKKVKPHDKLYYQTLLTKQ